MSLLHDHDFVHRQVKALHDHLARFENEHTVPGVEQHFGVGEIARVRQALRQGMENDRHHPGGHYYARDPLISLVQSAAHQQLVEREGVQALQYTDEQMGDAFTKWDLAGWVVEVGLSLIWRFLHGRHRFQDAPATATLEENARLILFSDWGTGLEGADQVAEHAATFIRDSEVPVHVMHLGDTYYSGTPFEAKRHILTPWPVSVDQADDVGSWVLNGNHDMYSGGEGLFETTLRDPRFKRQSTSAGPTSWFHLQSDQWDVVGLDSAYRDPLVDLRGGDFFLFGALGYLYGSQADYVNGLGAPRRRRLLLLSHHQLFSAYDEAATQETPIKIKLQPTLAGPGVDAWFWGHEHDCLAYDGFEGVRAARVIGHGAVPDLVRTDPPGEAVPGAPAFVVKPKPSPTAASVPALNAVKWEYRDYREGDDDPTEHWGKHGFAVVDIVGDTLHVSHVDDDGNVYMTETI